MKSTVTVSMLVLTGAMSTLAAQSVLCPDNHHFSESAIQAQPLGSTNWWGTTAGGRRMMILYDASHFTAKAGVAGPILITNLMFRGEDAERNTGGQTFSGITVHVYKTTLTSATMASTTVFASNITAVGTTSLMPGGTPFAHPNIVCPASLGTTPNNDIWNLDLSGAGLLPFDPTDVAGGANLLVDIAWTGYANGPAIPPSATSVPAIPTNDTTAHGAGVRGRGIYAASPTATSGTSSAAPPTMRVDFLGGGGSTLQPATTERFGASCGGSASTFYQLFVQGQAFDLANTSLSLIPDVPPPAAPNFYIVVAGTAAPDVTKVNAAPNSTTDDAVLAATSLGFTSGPFRYPGGSTTQIRPATNGFIWLDPAMTATDFSPTLGEFLGSSANLTARLCPFWRDFDPGENTVSHPNSGLHMFVDTSGGAGNAVCYVTWLNVSEFNVVQGVGGQSASTMQCVIHEATGIVEYRYGSMSIGTGSGGGAVEVQGFVGFTRGRITSGPPVVASVDPQSRNLSHETPFSTGPELAANVSFTAVSTPLAASAHYGARMFGGQSLTFNVGNVPSAPVPFIIGAINLDLLATSPGIQFPGITAPGCMISTGASPLILGWEIWVVPAAGPSSFTGTLPLVVSHSWYGSMIIGQAIGLDFSGGPNLVAWASNAVQWVVGLD